MDKAISRRRMRHFWTAVVLVVVAAGLYGAILIRFGQMMSGGN